MSIDSIRRRCSIAGIVLVALCSAACGGTSHVLPSAVVHPDAMHLVRPASNTWTTGASDLVARHGAAAAAVGASIYVIGGMNGSGVLGKNDIYDTSTNTWSTGAAMPTKRGGVTAAAMNGIVYVIGGFINTGDTPTDLVQAYNPVTNKWTTMAPEPVSAFQQEAAVFNGKIYVAGGYNGSRISDVFSYDPSTNVWSTAPSLLLARQSAFIGAIGNDLVVAGGYTNANAATAEAERLVVGATVWHKKHSMPKATASGCGAAIGTLLYTAGGFQFGGGLTQAQSYDPVADAWTALTPMPTAQVFPASAVANGQLYCFDGEPDNKSGKVFAITQIYTP